jgi:hypothetical protein
MQCSVWQKSRQNKFPRNSAGILEKSDILKKMVIDEGTWVLQFDPEPNAEVSNAVAERQRKSRMSSKNVNPFLPAFMSTISYFHLLLQALDQIPLNL